MSKKPTNFFKNNWLIFLLIIIIGGSFFYSEQLNKSKSDITEVDISRVVERINNGEVDHIIVQGNKLDVYLKDLSESLEETKLELVEESVGGNSEVKNEENTEKNSEEKTEKKKSREVAYKEDGVSMAEYGITPEKVKIEVKDNESNALWVGALSMIAPFLLFGALIWFMLRGAQGANQQAMAFGKSKARVNITNSKVTFGDVAGSEEAKKDLIEVVDFLKNPKKYRDLGAEIPKGILLVGPPGTGKTLLAKAVSGEAGVPFFSISGSEFVEMFVGVGASRVRDLFAKAKRNAPCIIFIDEIDAVGRQRGAGLGGSHDEREQTLNQILVELDGFDTEANVIVMAATNRPDVLDPALLRPGRFDRRVLVDLPDIKEREAILNVHAKGKPFDPTVDLRIIAQKTPGFSGADLKNVLNESAILTARENKIIIGMIDINEAIEKIFLGPQRRTKVITDEEKKITAYHEAGHALVSHFLPNSDPVHKISIISRGRALGYTWNMPEIDRVLYSKSRFEDDIAVYLAGREAELMIFGELTTGAQNDLQQATKMARKMVTEYGMSDKVGAVSYNGKDDLVFLGRDIAEAKNYSEKTAQLIDDEIQILMVNGEKKSREVLSSHKEKLEKLVAVLLEKETIERTEFEQIIAD